MLRIAICDDDKEIRIALQDAVRAYPHSCCVDLYSDGMGLLKERKNYDIIFLDIGMKGMDGIETAKKLRTYDKTAKIIYVTSYSDYQSYAFSVHAFAYLKKPVAADEVHRQLTEVLDYQKADIPVESIRFQTETGTEDIHVTDIYYLEYVQRRIRICTVSGDYWIRGSIAETARKMQAYDFCMPHKSFTVNLYYVKAIKGYDITMMNGDIIPLSQKKSTEFRECLGRYLAEHI